MAKDVKRAIAAEFRSSVIATSLSQTRIETIVKDLGINRNTFYYHFSNKYMVALWQFRNDLARALRRETSEKHLLYAPVVPGSKEELPYWVHYELGARTLDTSAFVRAYAKCLLADDKLYKSLFSLDNYEFLDFIARLFRKPISADIDYMLNGRYFPPSMKEMFVVFWSQSIAMLGAYFVSGKIDAEHLLDQDANPFWNFMSESMHQAIESHPIRRPRIQE